MEPNELDTISLPNLLTKLKNSSEPNTSVLVREIIRRFEPLLHKVFRTINSNCDYNDFRQEVFLRLFRNLHSLINPEAFPGYFRSIILTTATDILRQSIRLARADSLGVQQKIAQRFDEQILTKLFVRSYLEELPPRERAVIELSFLEDWSNTSIAKHLGIASSTVRVEKSRALIRLRHALIRDAGSLEKKSRDS